MPRGRIPRNLSKLGLPLPHYTVGIFQVATSFRLAKYNLLFAYTELMHAKLECSLVDSRVAGPEMGAIFERGPPNDCNKLDVILNSSVFTFLGMHQRPAYGYQDISATLDL
jgi:hypothetical protein